MKRLAVTLRRCETVLIGRVTMQDTGLRNVFKDVPELHLAQHNGYHIVSNLIPMFGSDSLWIRGYHPEFDDNVFCADYGSIEKAQKALDAFEYMIDEINKDEWSGKLY